MEGRKRDNGAKVAVKENENEMGKVHESNHFPNFDS